MSDREIFTRGNLPHWYVPGAAHFVTFRLAGTVPTNVLQSLHHKKEQLLSRPPLGGMSPIQQRTLIHKQIFADYDRFLDQNVTCDWLKQPPIASLLRRSLYFHNGSKYHLLSYCIMPNHVHILIQPIETDSELAYEPACGESSDQNSPLASIMHSIKSYTANEANKLLGRSGQLWQHESYDHWVRDDEELERIIRYIDMAHRKSSATQHLK